MIQLEHFQVKDTVVDTKQYNQTHTVENQSQPLEGYNLFQSDVVLQEIVEQSCPEFDLSILSSFGQIAGHEMLDWGVQANEFPPKFLSHDRYGHRIDRIDFHPSYHSLMQTSISHGMHSLPWLSKKPGRNAFRAAMMYMHHQVEQGTCCPLTMTFASVPTLQKQPSLQEEWLQKVFSTSYDFRNVPYFEKPGLTIGMAMTEKQGGSDVRSNTTTAVPTGEDALGRTFEVTGHKWFCSAPMCDGFLMLAQTEKGLSCFLLPRWKPTGEKNQMEIQRLKDKLGNRSNASSEVEYRGAFAWLIGEEGRGIANILEMVAMTRFDCIIGSASIMRHAVAKAYNHCSFRKAFGKKLINQPLMRNVLADLALESEAALALGMRIANALDKTDSEEEKYFARIATAVGKYWVCKRTPNLVYEASECFGGAGYVEESGMPRLYREAPLNSIWEGSGNVQCLDVLRVLAKTPKALQALLKELESARNLSTEYDRFLDKVHIALKNTEMMEYRSRTIVEKLALALQASLLLKSSSPEIGESFVQARLSERNHLTFGCLSSAASVDTLLLRANPLT